MLIVQEILAVDGEDARALASSIAAVLRAKYGDHVEVRFIVNYQGEPARDERAPKRPCEWTATATGRECRKPGFATLAEVPGIPTVCEAHLRAWNELRGTKGLVGAVREFPA